MSRNIRQTALSGILGSKRIIVAVCAAIAMVLGAMSVGASLFVPQSSAESDQQAANAPIFTERKGNSSPPQENGGIFTNQHAMVPDVLQSQPAGDQPTASKPKSGAGVGIEFGPVNMTAGITLGNLQVKIDATSLAPTIEPAPGTEPAVLETPTPTSETPTEEIPKEEVPPTDQTPPSEGSDPQPMSLMSGGSAIQSSDNPTLN